MDDELFLPIARMKSDELVRVHETYHVLLFLLVSGCHRLLLSIWEWWKLRNDWDVHCCEGSRDCFLVRNELLKLVFDFERYLQMRLRKPNI